MNLPPASFILFWPLLVFIVFLVITALRPAEPRITCPGNLKIVGFALLAYAEKHARELPAKLDAIVGDNDVTREMLRCPVPREHGPEAEYVYTPCGNRSTAPSDSILAYENPGNHEERGGNVLFADGHVKWRKLADLAAATARAKANSAATATHSTTQPD